MNKFILHVLILSVSCQPKYNSETKSLTSPLIYGKWQVVSSTFLPFDHISYCKNLELNSIFYFDRNGALKVYETDTSKTNCNQTQSFWIDSTGLHIFEYDFSFEYELVKLTSDSLILKTKNIPQYVTDELYKSRNAESENDTIRYIRENGILLCLKKIKENN